jgi:phenylpropionate dioxygenase-like ring-hydroxylating dioxygenase large terminal subunit
MNAVTGNNQAEWPPSWRMLSHGLRTGRYTDPVFAMLEHEKLWSRVWQFAARLDELPGIGDHTKYDIGDQSVMLVRVDADTIKAYHNACPHRGTALVEGAGCFKENAIRCPFHGWRWNLQGGNEFVMERQEFRDGKLQDSDVALREVSVEVFAGFIFINLERDPPSFAEFIEPVRGIIEGLAIGDMHHYWWRSMSVAANWKVAQEAFFETFHVAATHPQLDDVGREIVYEGREVGGECTHSRVNYDTFEHGHGRFYSSRTPISSNESNPDESELEHMIEHMAHLYDEMDAMVLKEDVEVAASLRGKPVPEGSTYGAEFIKAIYTKAALEQRPMPVPTPETTGMWGGMVFVFPNLLILPNLGNAMIYRVRPDGMDPDNCLFEIWSTRSYGRAETIPKAEPIPVEDPTDPEQLLLIPRQDFSNIPRVQRGVHSRGCKQIWLASHNEKIIMGMHQELDRYLVT